MSNNLTLTIGRLRADAIDLADASKVYCRIRAKRPSSRFPEGRVTDETGNFVARISYNGRVWASPTWQPGETPIMEAQG
ncbi:MAG: hypothetical protein FJ271_27405 [Planctomycetes bacterium]|nr:hypothetical protein [Planctomycetota bacterium]